MANRAKSSEFVVTPYDAAEYLTDPASQAAYLNATLAEVGNDPVAVAKALGTIARAKGMTVIASDTGLGRQSLYKALSGDRAMELPTFLKVLDSFGLTLQTNVKAAAKAAKPTPTITVSGKRMTSKGVGTNSYKAPAVVVGNRAKVA